MEVCKARPRLLPAIIPRRRFRSSLFGVRRFLAPYIFHWTYLQNAIKINHQVAICNCLLKSPVTTTSVVKKDASSRGELCKVIWTIEADLADGQLLYISGDPFTLGSWEPEMAVLLSPSTKHPNLWKTSVKVPCGTNFKYNYFIRKDKWPSCDFIWRPGPEFSVSIPLFSEQNKKILVRDSWLTDQSERLPAYSWGSWIEETILAANPVTDILSGDDHENLTSCESGYLDLKSSSIDLTVKDESYSSRKDDTSTYSNNGSDFSETYSERDQPVEEPWLLQSSTYYLQFKDSIHDPDKDSIESMLEQVVCPDKSFLGTENPDCKSKLTCFKEPVSTVILINSSKCTMQRIAVLEDGKLVELLLEPVKDNVQCGSVYLGEITKLVPRMGGALVNIGLHKSSLMEIRNQREPFIFPPFNHMAKEKESNGSVIGKQTDHSDTHDSEPSSEGDIEVCNGSAGFDFQDDPVLFSHEDFEENEIGDDFNVPGVRQGNLNGSAVDYGGKEADFDDYCDGNGHQLEGESETVNDFLPVEMEDSHVSQPPRTLKRSVDASRNVNKWDLVRKGTKIIVQVVKEGYGSKSPSLTAFPTLKSRFWRLMCSRDEIGVSGEISGDERTRMRIIANSLQPPGFGLKVRAVAAGHPVKELQKDLEGLLYTWKDIMEKAKSAALAADEGVDGAVPVILLKAMGQTLSVAQDCFNEDLRMVVDSPRTYREVTNYLEEIAPDLCDRVELYDKKNPIFDEYGIEEEINNMLNKRVPLANGGSLVIEQTEALVSIDVNGGHGMMGHGTSQEKAVLDVNLAAAKQVS